MKDRNFIVGVIGGFCITEFTYFCLYLLSEQVFEMTALFIFIAVFLLLILIDFYSYIHISNLQKIKYKTVTISYKSGKTKKAFENVTNYKVDNHGYITFLDENGIWHYSVTSWKFTSHSKD